MEALAGAWAGEYASTETGRGGSIVFTLLAGEGHAHGDVMMGPRRSLRPVQAPSMASRPLTIRFVRVEGGRVSGSMAPPAAPTPSAR